jgi:peptide/nickel transport system permease protein
MEKTKDRKKLGRKKVARSYLKSLSKNWQLFKENKLGVVGLIVIISFLIFGLSEGVYIFLMGEDAYEPLKGMDMELERNIGYTNTYAWPPFSRHPLGTDYKGGDILAQLMCGAKMGFLVGITAALTSVLIGTILGLISGYWGGKTVDSAIMRGSEIILCIPILPLIIVISAVVGRLSIWSMVFILGVLIWPNVAKVVRSQTLSLREMPFIESAKVSGANSSRLLFKQLAPNVLPFSFLYMTFNVTTAILTEASVSFLGFGDPTKVSWGMMLQWCFTQGHTFTALWWMLPPGICIALLSMSFYFVGLALDEIVNPRLRER